MAPFTHDELVRAAAQWVVKRHRCRMVLTEYQSWLNAEHPDVIGFHPAGHSVMVECKITRSDFLRDRNKTFKRRGGDMATACGMGRLRYYLAPEGIVRLDDLHEDGPLHAYGLLLPHRSRRGVQVIVAKDSRVHCNDVQAENVLLVNVSRRLAGYDNYIPSFPRNTPEANP